MSPGPTKWFVNATQDYSALPVVCAQARSTGQIIHILHYQRDREAVIQTLPPGQDLFQLVKLDDTGLEIPGLENDHDIIFLPCVDGIDWSDLRQLPALPYPHCIQLLAPNLRSISPLEYTLGSVEWFGWRASGELARRILREPSALQPGGIDLIVAVQRWPDPPRWQSIPLQATGSDAYPRSSPPRVTMSSSVLAVISFYGCEEWLHGCLTSMSQQTRPPENIVVIDDCSPALPIKYLEPFPTVTLLSTTRNVGPEKILNNIIHATDYDAYMVQDADDWSSHDRLELSLRAFEQSGADIVGTHDVRVNLPTGALELCVYPPDVNYAMTRGISHYILHCTTLISRSIAMKIGGFDERLKVSADTDFIMRACHAGRIINLPSFCLFHRTREGSLTTHKMTGHESTARKLEDRFIKVRAKRNVDLALSGQNPNVFMKQTEPVTFIHHQGPKLRSSSSARDGDGAL